jgi:hypothetical protein
MYNNVVSLHKMHRAQSAEQKKALSPALPSGAFFDLHIRQMAEEEVAKDGVLRYKPSLGLTWI